MRRGPANAVSTSTSFARWIRTVAGGEAAACRVALADGSGRLRVVAIDGEIDAVDPGASRRRRRVFDSGRAKVVPARPGSRIAQGFFPLVANGSVLGVVEVFGDHSLISARRDALIALVDRSAEELNATGGRAELDQTLESNRALLGLASELLGVRTATEAVRTTVRRSGQHLEVPVVGLLPDRDHQGWFMAAAEGLDARSKSALGRILQQPSRRARDTRPGPRTLRRRFMESTGRGGVAVVRAGSAVVLFGDVDRGLFVDGAAALLAGVIARIGASTGPSQDPFRDIGLAWVAHELRGPLLGVKAALELMLIEGEGSSDPDPIPLARSLDEIEGLSELVQATIAWSGGTRPLERRAVDLVEIVDDVVADCAGRTGHDRIVVHAPATIVFRADPLRVRSAVANVIRNALAYSPTETKVDVTVEQHDDAVLVSVRNEGALVRPDAFSLFEPFVRGNDADRHRPGGGIGLFIARRVVEAHGGRIWFESSDQDTTFYIRLPIRGVPSR